jgi:hypothetical protein
MTGTTSDISGHLTSDVLIRYRYRIHEDSHRSCESGVRTPSQTDRIYHLSIPVYPSQTRGTSGLYPSSFHARAVGDEDSVKPLTPHSILLVLEPNYRVGRPHCMSLRKYRLPRVFHGHIHIRTTQDGGPRPGDVNLGRGPKVEVSRGISTDSDSDSAEPPAQVSNIPIIASPQQHNSTTTHE